MPISLLESTVDIASIVDFRKNRSKSNVCGLIPKKIDQERERLTVDIDRRSEHTFKKAVDVDLTHPQFITHRSK